MLPGIRVSEQFSLSRWEQERFPITQSPQASVLMFRLVQGPMLRRQDCLFDTGCGRTFLNGSLGAGHVRSSKYTQP